MFEIYLLGIAAGVAIVLLVCLPRSKASRVVHDHEGMENEEVVLEFARMQKTSAFKAYRDAAIKRLFEPKDGTGPKTGENLLDLGCGTGDFLVQLGLKLDQADIDLELYGLDVSEEILKTCRENVEQSNVKVKALEHAGAASSPFPDGYFFYVVTSNSLHHWANPGKIFDEIYRILKQGGRLILMDFRRDARRCFHFLLRFITRFIVTKAFKRTREPIASLLSSYSRPEIEEMLAKTPWKDTEIHFKGKTWYFTIELRKSD